MSRRPILVLAITLPFVANAEAAGAHRELSGCYEVVAGTFSGMETSATSNQGVFFMKLRQLGPGKKLQVEIAGTQSTIVNATKDEVVCSYTLTDFLRTGQMNLIGHFAAAPQVVDTCIAEDGSAQPIIQYTIEVVPDSGTGRFSGLHGQGGMTFTGTVEYCGKREDFSVVSGGTVCF